MLVCGDGELNPGPHVGPHVGLDPRVGGNSGRLVTEACAVPNPCTVCCSEVKDNESAIDCDYCSVWAHAACAGVDENEYCHSQILSNFSWLCPPCSNVNGSDVTLSYGIPFKGYDGVHSNKDNLNCILLNARSIVNTVPALFACCKLH